MNNQKMKYEAVKEYLENYSSDTPPYDPIGVMYLLKAIMKNIQKKFTEFDFEEYAVCLDEENEALLKKLITAIPISREIRQQEEEGDSNFEL